MKAEGTRFVLLPCGKPGSSVLLPCSTNSLASHGHCSCTVLLRMVRPTLALLWMF